MNFSNEKCVFSSQEPMRFKGVSAVLSRPTMLGAMTNTGMGKLPSPMGLSSKPLGFERIDAHFDKELSTPIRTGEGRFAAFEGTPKRAFGLVSNLTPMMLLKKLEHELEEQNEVDYHRVEHDDTAIRGRAFGDLNNAEFEIRVFWFDESKSYAEFNRLCGDSWEFGRFVERILNAVGEERRSVGFPALPLVAHECGLEDLEAMLVDVEESYQDIAEHSAAELAKLTQKDVARQLCDQIEGFCSRILKVLEESTNCAIVRSLLICLTNMTRLDGLTKRILTERQRAVRDVENKWAVTQTLFDGLFSIAPSQEVRRYASMLLLSV